MDLNHLIKLSNLKKITFSPVDLALHHTGGGIYRMRDKTGEVIYVGKSQNLHRRMLQHTGRDTNTAYFIDQVDRFEWTFEGDPVYQNLLEAIFIAYHRPKFNDEVKDAERNEPH